MKKSGSQQLLAKQRLPRASVRLHGLGECLLLLGSGFRTAGAQIGGLALPLGACLTASLPFGRRSLSAALGAAEGVCILVSFVSLLVSGFILIQTQRKKKNKSIDFNLIEICEGVQDD